MLSIKETLLINTFGQDLITTEPLISLFNEFDTEQKRGYLTEIRFLIMQSKPDNNDIEIALRNSLLRPTYTPCVLLRKGVEDYKLKKINDLPEPELEKALIVFLNLFKVAYQRRFNTEKNDPFKWWYWDLSDLDNLKKIEDMYG
ncbi:MAG: hypothetical protein DI539_02720 [Flavobacterium psychrophilum]|nr:MAG: hypothetical protein DI539_02720 [Flavobacterium psychrophilum]